MMILRLRLAVLSLVTATLIPALSNATSFTYWALLGPDAAPQTGTGAVQVDLDDVAHTMRVQANWSGLSGTTTIAHIHAPTALPLTGTANVATQLPSFSAFPVGVTAGTFDQTLDLTLA